MALARQDPTAAALQQFLHALGDHEPGLYEAVTAAFCHLSPIHRPLLLLHSKQFKRLQAAVKALPRGWRTPTQTTLRPSVRNRLTTVANMIPRELLAIVPSIVAPHPDRVRIQARYRGPSLLAPLAPGFSRTVHGWYVLRRCVPPGEMPVAALDARHILSEHRHIPLTPYDRVRFWDRRIPNRCENFIHLFELAFPPDVGRLLYAVAMCYETGSPGPPWPARATVDRFCREYNRIKKVHVPPPGRAQREQQTRNERWLALAHTNVR